MFNVFVTATTTVPYAHRRVGFATDRTGCDFWNKLICAAVKPTSTLQLVQVDVEDHTMSSRCDTRTNNIEAQRRVPPLNLTSEGTLFSLPPLKFAGYNKKSGALRVTTYFHSSHLPHFFHAIWTRHILPPGGLDYELIPCSCRWLFIYIEKIELRGKKDTGIDLSDRSHDI